MKVPRLSCSTVWIATRATQEGFRERWRRRHASYHNSESRRTLRELLRGEVEALRELALYRVRTGPRIEFPVGVPPEMLADYRREVRPAANMKFRERIALRREGGQHG